MMELRAVLVMMCLVFGVVGAMRGWAREILVVFSLLLAIFISTLVQTYLPTVHQLLQTKEGFVLRLVAIVGVMFFGYHAPQPTGAAVRVQTPRMPDMILGCILGLLNGYLLFGTLWFYLDQAGYPLPFLDKSAVVGPTAEVLEFLPPKLLAIPTIYFFVGGAFLFVIILFV